MALFEELQWRGLVYDHTEGLREVIDREVMAGYIGFDPTAASLHVGSFLPIMMLARLQRAGHQAVALVGGGTGLIGDPKPSSERALLSHDQVSANVAGIKAQLSRILDFDAGSNPAVLVDNADWLVSLGAIAFMRDVGKHFTVNAMLSREAVKRRLEGDGISYTEFSYALLQAYDFLELFDQRGCTLQLGGSDQWGNIVAGIDLIRRVRGARAFGLVSPLITNAAGGKFGKTEAGAVWLDAALTSPFRFYQFWLNTDDRDAAKYLRFFTWLDRSTISALEHELSAAPERREAQRTLAREVTVMVHGAAETAAAERAASVLFGSTLSDASAVDILAVFDDVPATEFARAMLEEGVAATELVVRVGLAQSKGEAVRLIRQGGLYINDLRFADERGLVDLAHAIDGKVIVLRKGQRDRRVIRIL